MSKTQRYGWGVLDKYQGISYESTWHDCFSSWLYPRYYMGRHAQKCDDGLFESGARE